MTITLATLAKATSQEVFDQVATHLLKQNAQALDNDGQCVYRGLEGTMCAAGCLIGGDEYKHSMEGNTWLTLSSRGAAPSDHEDLIRQLQFIHDQKEPFQWYEALAKTALSYGLEYKH